jgi:hypothetical protein
MKPDNSLSSAQVEYQRGVNAGKQLAFDAALEAIAVVKLQHDGTYKLGNTGYSNPLSAAADAIINLKKHYK